MSWFKSQKHDVTNTESAVDGIISPILHRYDITAVRMSQKQRKMNAGPIVKHVGIKTGNGGGDKKPKTKK